MVENPLKKAIYQQIRAKARMHVPLYNKQKDFYRVKRKKLTNLPLLHRFFALGHFDMGKERKNIRLNGDQGC